MVPFASASPLTAPSSSSFSVCHRRAIFGNQVFTTQAQPPRPRIVGVVVFPTHRGERAEAILDSRGRWRCPRLPVLERVLNVLYDPDRDPRNGQPFGHAALARAAGWLKGEVMALGTVPPQESGAP